MLISQCIITFISHLSRTGSDIENKVENNFSVVTAWTTNEKNGPETQFSYLTSIPSYSSEEMLSVDNGSHLFIVLK
jgi:hypothetical protein